MLKSEFFEFTPCCRETFIYLLFQVNYEDGKRFKRGQQFFQIARIREDLSWYVGFRKHQYTDNQIRTALTNLVSHELIRTMKTARGLHVTICKYDTYQNPKNYETRTEPRAEPRAEPRDDSNLNHGLKQKNKAKEQEQTKERERGNISEDNLSVTSRVYDATKGKYVVVESESKKERQGEVTELVEISKGWMPHQSNNDRYMVAKAIKDLGYDLCKRVTEDYLKNINKVEQKIQSPQYWWKSGIYAHANKSAVVTQPVKMIIRKCGDCKAKHTFDRTAIPDFCPTCSDGMLYSEVEWNSVYNAPPIKSVSEPSTDVPDSEPDMKSILKDLGESLRM
jgi:hypothetical protein